jgi:hypothetical protein
MNSEIFGRKVMGRKGIGKLAGFGIASKMTVITWQENKSIEITLDLALLNIKPKKNEEANKLIEGVVREGIPFTPFGKQKSGTRITLSFLKQASSIQIEPLHESLSRRFNRTVQGRMQVFLNGEALKKFNLSLHPLSRKFEDGDILETLNNGKKITYNYVFTDKPIRENELRGWTIQVNGKTAQKPNFFFDVDANGMSQHSSKYLCGDIQADYLDEGIKDEDDMVSTDRQEIDWERPETRSLWEFGRKLTQKIFIEIAERNAEENVNVILQDEKLSARIDKLDSTSRGKVLQFIKSIGTIKVTSEDITDTDKIKKMGDQIIKAFEYRHFIDVIEDIEKASDDPESLNLLLEQLGKWEVLESRALLEIIQGRLVIVDKFHSLTVNDAPETANRKIGADNMHDLLAGFPWLLNPEWQILSEEKTITKQLKEWGEEDIPDPTNRDRYDFLGMKSNGFLVVIEIKRSNHPVELEEIQRLEKYQNRLSKTHKNIICVLIYGGTHNLSEAKFKQLRESEEFILVTWEEIYQRNYEYYNHYRAVLEGHIEHPDFSKKVGEVQKIKEVIAKGTIYRNPDERKQGLGSQDSEFEKPA